MILKKVEIKNIISKNKRLIFKIAIALVLAILMVIVSNVLIQPKIFNVKALNYNRVHKTLIAVFSVFVFVFSYFVINFIDKLYKKDRFYKIWLINFLIYFAVMFIFLLLIWPGHWVSDEFGILGYTVNLDVRVWQSYITIIYYSICLMLFPSPISIVIMQILIISLIFSYVFTNIYIRYKNKIINIIIYVFMLTPAVILNNLYPLRITLYGYIMLLFFAILIFDWIEQRKLTVSKFLTLSIMTILLMLWRSEGIIFLIVEPILLALSYKNINKKIIVIILLILLNGMAVKTYNIYLHFLKGSVEYEKNRYSLTIFINPLSEMLQEELKGKNIDKDIENINKVLNVEVLKKYPSYTDIVALWEADNLLQPDWQTYLKDFKKSYIDIIINNSKSFIKARMKTFLATSCYYNEENPHIFGGSLLLNYCYIPDYNNQRVNYFLDNYKFIEPLNKDIKANVERFLIGQDINTLKYNKAFLLIFWNVVPTFLLVLLFWIISIAKKKSIFFIVFSTLIGNFSIIFLTTPAKYFMYYVPFYICGTIMSLIFILQIKEERVLKIKGKENEK